MSVETKRQGVRVKTVGGGYTLSNLQSRRHGGGTVGKPDVISALFSVRDVTEAINQLLRIIKLNIKDLYFSRMRKRRGGA